MIGQTNKTILKNKRQCLLRGAMTDAERLLWRSLCSRQMAGYKFRSQHPFNDFILDFVCLEKKLVVEVDGGQHGGQLKADSMRTDRLIQAGFRVLRFWNHEVLMQIESVQAKILSALQVNDETPSPARPIPPKSPLEGGRMKGRKDDYGRFGAICGIGLPT